jgi:hypothetical protein
MSARKPAADVLAAAMSEDDLLTSVLDLAKVLKLRSAHFRPARTATGWRTAVSGDGKGWPDIALAGRRLLVRELKDMRGKPTTDQALWIAALDRAGVDVGVWTPADWLSGRIEAQMREVASC